MNRMITYQCQKCDQGNYEGKITVTKPSDRPIRFSVGALTKGTRVPKVRTWQNSFGEGIAIELCVPEDQAKIGFDHWLTAEAVLRDWFPDTEVIFLS